MSGAQPENLVQFLAGQLVSRPSAIRTRTQSLEDGVRVLLTVAENDRGKVIGKGGRTARALRSVIRAAGAAADARFELEIEER